jgi:uncharacterized membrane protein HdeD (DUF308 family)
MSNVLENIRYDVKNWWWFLITGLLFIATGIAIYARPAEGYLGLSVLFSVVIISSGLSQIFFASSNSKGLKGWGWILVSGIVDLAIGTYLLVYPVLTMATLPYFVGFWLIIRSFYMMGFSFDLKNLKTSGWGWLLFGGLVMLVLGLLVIYYPAAGVVSIIAVSGSAFILGGILNIYVSFQLKDLKSQVNNIKEAVGKVKSEYKHA